MPTKSPARAASQTSPTSTERRSARDRLLAAAGELFYEEGVHTVGIDRVIERAGVAKASLYNTFGSKDELILAYLEGRHASIEERVTRAIAEHDTPRERLLAIFDSQAKQFNRPGYRGCAFANASAETTPGSVIERASDGYRGWLRTTFAGLAREAGATDPDALSRQLLMIYDGAGLSARMDRNRRAARDARGLVEGLLDAAIPPQRTSTAAKRTAAGKAAKRTR